MTRRQKKRLRTQSSKREFFQRAAQEYMREKGVTVIDPDDVAQWMIDTGQYQESAYSAVRRCRSELTNALRSQRMTDAQGRDVRAMLCARYKNEDGHLFSQWSPLYEAPPKHARLSLQQWRKSIKGEVLLHDRTTRSYNDNNVHGEQLPLFDYDMNKDRDEATMPEEYPDERPSDETGDQPS